MTLGLGVAWNHDNVGQEWSLFQHYQPTAQHNILQILYYYNYNTTNWGALYHVKT